MALNSLLLLLAALASSVIAQSSVTVMPEATSTMMLAASPTPTPTMMPANEDDNVSVLAQNVQRDHFFCLGTDTPTNRAAFRSTPDSNAYRWGIWIQYPVLSYLDTMRKRHLMNVIAQLVGGGDLFYRLCIAEVEQYGVSTYRESVFIKLYLNDSADLDNLDMLERTFNQNFEMGNNPHFSTFLDRRAINVTAIDPLDGRSTLPQRTVNDSVHPGCDSDRCPEGDPTLLAVVIGTYVGRAYITVGDDVEEVTIENLENGISGFTRRAEFAENPRPINYGLEAGDIVFAVFGSVFLAILTGAIILGFVIHPFCLA